MFFEFNVFVGDNLFDKVKVVGKLMLCIDGLCKIIGIVFYVYECYDVVLNQVYGYIVGVGIGKGCIILMDVFCVCVVFGVLVVIIVLEIKLVGKLNWNNVLLFGGVEVVYYYQVIVCVVVEIFEQVCVVVVLICICYECSKGCFDFLVLVLFVLLVKGCDGKFDWQVLGDFDIVYVSVVVKFDEIYYIFDESYLMMELYVIIVVWEGDMFMLWMVNQMIDWVRQGMVVIFGIDFVKVCVDLFYIGGGFGGKLFICVDVVLVVLVVKQVGWLVKIVL